MRISSSPIASGTIEVASEARVPVAPDTLGTAFWRARKAAGIPDIRIHNLRHTAATRTMRKTRNLAVVQRQLGHKRVTTTMRYAHVAEADLRAAINATNPVESPAATSADVANRPEKLDKTA
jgi:integrase